MEQKRLLIVDDEPEIADVIRRCGEQVQFKVDVASDGVDGFARAQNGNYELVCMDIRMPLWSGVGASTAISMLNPNQKIFVISGYLDDETIEILDRHVNIVGFLHKPFEIRELMDRLQEFAKAS